MDGNLPCSPPLSMEFSRQEYWSGLPCPTPKYLPNPGIKPGSPALQADSLSLSYQGSPYSYISQFSCSLLSNSVTPWTAARQVSLSITNSWSLLKLMSIKSVMPFNHLILCHPLLIPLKALMCSEVMAWSSLASSQEFILPSDVKDAREGSGHPPPTTPKLISFSL